MCDRFTAADLVAVQTLSVDVPPEISIAILHGELGRALNRHSSDDWNANLLVLGDFNLDRLDDPLYGAFVSTGLFPPAELNKVPRTIFDNAKTQHFYDQIAWFSTPTGGSLLQGLGYTHRGGSFDFVPQVFPGLAKTQLSWRISDHYPLWVEFQTPP